ncbi:MAG: citrate (Si)-synthase [Candidatus Rhabdochlamydia sp.]
MDSSPLFQISTHHLETGLRGFPVGYCPTSTVDPLKGLFYRGIAIQDVAKWRAEKGMYLLLKGKVPTEEEVTSYFTPLQTTGVLSSSTLEAIQKLPRDKEPMKLFAAALLIAGMFESKKNYLADCEHLVMIIPELTAAVINHHAGWPLAPSVPALGYIENFIAMLGLPHPKTPLLEEAFRLFNVLHYDHGGGNLSTFVGKAVASGLEDLYGSLAASMCALAGARHGRANQDALEFVLQVLTELKGDLTASKVKRLIKQKMEAHELIFGFGHAVLRVEDPRAAVMYDVLERNFSDHPLVKTALLLRTQASSVLKENVKITNPYPNVDAISGVMLAVTGFNFPLYFPLLFGMARTVGIARQIVYERVEAREGKGTPIVRPRYLYNGPSSET